MSRCALVVLVLVRCSVPAVVPSKNQPNEGPPAAAPLGACGTLDSREIYVSAVSAGEELGTALCPLRTITKGLKAVADGGTVYVDRGLYDVALGEAFPLWITASVTIEGSGYESTVIRGAGFVDLAVHDGPLSPSKYFAGVWVHTAADAKVELRGVRLEPGADRSTTNVIGVLCDRGNAAVASDNFSLANLSIDETAIGTFGYGVVATFGGSPRSGCQLQLTRSRVDGATRGVWLRGGALPDQQVAATVGIGEDLGNGFSQAAVAAIDVSESVAWLNVSGNHFVGGARGVRSDAASSSPHVAIVDNHFSGATVAGVSLERCARVDSLNGNAFEGNATALSVGAAGACRAVVSHARKNRFVGNDRAVAFTGDVVNGRHFAAAGERDDFSPLGADDPGPNLFVCNSSVVPGKWSFDVELADAPGDSLSLDGNTWDHAPPVILVGVTGPTANGAEIWLPAGTMRVPSAISHFESCPQGRVAGPK